MRRLSLLSVLALLLGALSLFAPAPAEAQTPAAPTLVPGDGRLTASWTTAGDTYELQYKETSAPDRAA